MWVCDLAFSLIFQTHLSNVIKDLVFHSPDRYVYFFKNLEEDLAFSVVLYYISSWLNGHVGSLYFSPSPCCTSRGLRSVPGAHVRLLPTTCTCSSRD